MNERIRSILADCDVIFFRLSKNVCLHFVKMGILEKISEIEKEISRTQKNKGS